MLTSWMLHLERCQQLRKRAMSAMSGSSPFPFHPQFVKALEQVPRSALRDRSYCKSRERGAPPPLERGGAAARYEAAKDVYEVLRVYACEQAKRGGLGMEVGSEEVESFVKKFGKEHRATVRRMTLAEIETFASSL